MTHPIRDLWPLLWVRSLPDSMAFYRDVLGFEMAGSATDGGEMHWCRLRRGGACLMLQQVDPGVEPPAPRDALYLVCDDADAMYEELRERGVDVEPPLVAEYGMKQLFVPEPDGRELVLESPTEDWTG